MIVLDTHVLLWWFTGDTKRLSQTAKAVLQEQRTGGTIFVSSATAWEIAILVARNRIELSTDVLTWLEVVGRVQAIKFVPIDNEIAVKSTQLGDGFRRDPGDRYIVATCQKLGAPLVTADTQIRESRKVQTIW